MGLVFCEERKTAPLHSYLTLGLVESGGCGGGAVCSFSVESPFSEARLVDRQCLPVFLVWVGVQQTYFREVTCFINIFIQPVIDQKNIGINSQSALPSLVTASRGPCSVGPVSSWRL